MTGMKKLNYRASRWFHGRTRDAIADRLCRWLPRPAPKDDPTGARQQRLAELQTRGFGMLDGLCSLVEAEAPYAELSGFSRGSIPGITHERAEGLVFQVTYSLFPLYSPDRPEIAASELSSRYDPYINRLYVDPKR